MKAKQPAKPAARQLVLEARKNLKMAKSTEAFVRGTTSSFYEWLDSDMGRSIPDGPPVWICGDCHLGNLGPIANSEGQVEIAIRDLDQTVIGNPCHDLIRLGLSLAMAARSSDLPGVVTAGIAEQMIKGYDKALSNRSRYYKDFIHPTNPFKLILKQAVNSKWSDLAEERIEDAKPEIPLGKRFWPLSTTEKKEIANLFASEEARKLVTCLHDRDDDAPIKILDTAYWVKGCSSLGNLRYAVLIHVKGSTDKEEEYSLIDIKEAVKAKAPRKSVPIPIRNHAQRVVEGACNLSPFLGRRMLAARLMDRSVFVREVLPQDLQLEFDQLSSDEATSVAYCLASVLGKAHGRQMDIPTRRKWRSELAKAKPRHLNAPSWLWSSIVDLVSIHEMAYLDHCRIFATQNR